MLVEDGLALALEVDGVADLCGVLGEEFYWLCNVVLMFVCGVTY